MWWCLEPSLDRCCLPIVSSPGGYKAGAIKPKWRSKPTPSSSGLSYRYFYTVNPSQEGKTLLWVFAGISLAMMGRSQVLLAWLRKRLQEQEMQRIKESSKYEEKIEEQVSVLEEVANAKSYYRTLQRT